MTETVKPIKVVKKKTGYQLFFRKHYQELLLKSPGRSFGDCSKEIGRLWKDLPTGEKEKFNSSIQIENQSLENKEKKEEKEDILKEGLPPIIHPCRLKLNEFYDKEFKTHRLPILHVSENKNIEGEFITLRPMTTKKQKERLPRKSVFVIDNSLEEEEVVDAFLEKMDLEDEENDDLVESRLTEEDEEQKEEEENEGVEEELGSLEGRNDNEDISRSDDDSDSDGDSEEEDDVSTGGFMEDEICVL